MAERQFSSNLYKEITLDELKRTGVARVADYLKIEQELREIFGRVAHRDPIDEGHDGNFDADVAIFTTPAAVDTEFKVPHRRGAVPKGWHVVVPAKAGYGSVGSIYNYRDPDASNLYLAVRSSLDLNRVGRLVVW